MNDQNFFIVATSSISNNEFYYEELMKINNEHANTFRQTMKDCLQSHDAGGRDSQIYDQLSEFNNELANTQRELSKKNIQLEQQKQELKTLNQQLSNTINELEQTRDELIQSEKMASLGRLVSGFAHEINTPIGIAVTAASTLDDAGQSINYMLSQDEVNENDLVAALETIAEAGKMTLANLHRAAGLVRSFKRTSIDQSEDTKRLFKLSDIIQDIILSLASKFKNTAIRIEPHSSTEINIYGYPGVISQILANLLINSYIHGFENGSKAGKITIEARQENNTVYLDYADTGKGMNEEIAKKLFEPFYTTLRAKGCTGLGMYICYNIITSHLNGMINCESAIGKGTVFHISFPVELLDEKR